MRLISNSERETLRFAKNLAKYLKPGDILCLFGCLGAGKTIFVKGIAWGLGLAKDSIISPSFVLIREYPSTRGKFPLYHFDLYRLNNPQDIFKLGYEEYLYGGGVSVIEWADRLGKYLPPEYLRIELTIKGEQRRNIEIVPCGQRYKRLLR